MSGENWKIRTLKKVIIGAWMVIWAILFFHYQSVGSFYNKTESYPFPVMLYCESAMLLCLIMLMWLMIKLTEG